MRVHVVVPEGFDHPGQPTGGNIYDRRVCAGLAEAGWDVLVAGFVEQLQTRIARLGYGHRVRLTGVLTGAALSHAYTTADLLVAPSVRRPTA